MKRYIRAFFVMTLNLCAMAVTHASPKEPTLCEVFAKFSENLSVGETRWVKLSMEKKENALFGKLCRPSSMDDRGRTACEWLSRNTSNEFMDKNISQAITCLTGGGSVAGKNILIKEMSGVFTVFDPFIEESKTKIEFQYFFRSDSNLNGSFYLLKASGLKN